MDAAAHDIERRYGATPEIAAPGLEERFEQLLDRNHRRLRRFVAGIVADRDRVDDVLQETYLRAYRKLPREFANQAHESTWLYRVAYRCAIDEVRRARRRERERPLDAAAADGRVEDGDNARRLALEGALAGVPPRDRAVLLLVLVAGFDYAQAAATLGIPRGTLAWRLSVARRRFREALEREGL